eukprot:gene2655-3072_t
MASNAIIEISSSSEDEAMNEQCGSQLNWTCNVCTLINSKDCKTCKACDSSVPELQQLVGDMESLQSPTKSENLDNAPLKRRQERTANEEPTQIASSKRKIVMSYCDNNENADQQREISPSGVLVYGTPSQAPTAQEALDIIYLNALHAKNQDIDHVINENGVWTDFSKPRKAYALTKEGKFVPANASTPKQDMLILYRSYRTHKHTKEFRCQVLTAVNGNDERLDKGILYYYFKNSTEVPVRMMPHGNAKNPTAEPHVRTERNILKKLKDECQQDTGKSAVDNVFLEMGSIYDLKYQSELPRNTKQAYNIAYQAN